MYGVIDIGTNSIKLEIFAIENGQPVEYFNKKSTIGLARYIDKTGIFGKEGIRATINVLENFKEILKKIGVKDAFAFATYTFRKAKNVEFVVDEIKKETGFEVEVLSMKEERSYGYYGTNKEIKDREGILLDIGGGSTDIVFFKENDVLISESVQIGTLKMYNKFVRSITPAEEEVKIMRKAVQKELQPIKKHYSRSKPKELYVVGGAGRVCSQLYKELFGSLCEIKSIERKYTKEMVDLLFEDRMKIVEEILKIAPEKIHTVFPGLVIMHTVAKSFGCKKINIETRGLREGFLKKNLDLI